MLPVIVLLGIHPALTSKYETVPRGIHEEQCG